MPGDWPAEVEQLVAFTPWLVLPAAAGLLFAVLGRRGWRLAAAGALLAVQLLWLFPQDYLVAAGYSPGAGCRGDSGQGCRTAGATAE